MNKRIRTATQKKELRKRRHGRVRSRVQGTHERPRLSVHRSNRAVRVQIIDDDKMETLVAASSVGSPKSGTVEVARDVGERVAKEALKKNITTVVFDRGGFNYHGKVKAVAEGARQGGLVF